MFTVGQELTQDNAMQVIAAGKAAILAGESEFDFSGLSRLDSSAVAAMIEWQRQLLTKSQQITCLQVPAGLESLIRLYGLSEQFATHASVQTPERH
ncbi:STAS domain-containing protein [Undibacterium crateris]|uniref:STAS domain-containing protein n=1 Tax=Undibacterium crateris TaxID=2528175 RepID=UPI0013896DA3|nr:STAS domain-containing protein [Undibacterium crateris]NDI84701.1 STAS domain-containing protein [Undibacterium crateris]